MKVRTITLLILLILCWLPKTQATDSTLAVITSEDILKSNQWQGLVAMQSFKLPANAKSLSPISSSTQINLKLIANSDYFQTIKDSYQIATNPIFKAKQLPDIHFAFVQQGIHLIPLDSSVQRANHPQWEWQVSPGYQWQEKKTGYSVMVFPFSLQERNANCTHNGMIKIVLDQKNKKQRGFFQIASETCAYFQLNWVGSLKVSLKILPPSNQATNKISSLVKRFEQQQTSQIETLDAKALLKTYPKLELKKLMPKDLSASTLSGVVIKGVDYRLNCGTRAGDYPFCDALALPSFSTAKSLFAGLILMRMQALVAGIDKLLVTKFIPECKRDKWHNVTLADLLNMRTGIYRAKDPHADESSKEMLAFFLQPTAQQKLQLACGLFTRKSQPGKRFHYHTSDTYLAGVMLNRIFTEVSDQTDVYESIFKGEMIPTLGLSPLLDQTKRTYDLQQQAFTGWGMTYYASDFFKLVDFLWQQDQLAKSKQHKPILDSQLLTQVMHPGVAAAAREAGNPSMRYNHGFWALEVSQSLGCKQPRWLPFMSGFGGISVVMIAPDLLYYNFSDNYRFEWLKAVKAINRVVDLCH
ncbi:MAG: serine hydrolase domain-containing protein [Enterobacterales bacterium]|nr:serine hydrolase domain-containing protein [Enterobacterales bacterium]